MALKGDLASVDLAQVFQMLALNQKVGLLGIQSPTSWKALYFDDRGVTLYFNEHTMLDRVLSKLIRSGVIAEDGVNDAREHASRHGQAVLDSLLAGGYLGEEDLNHGIRNEVEEEIYELFFWYDAKFEFFEGATSYEGHEGVINDRFFFGTDILIMEAARRIDEWSYIQAQVPNSLEIHRLARGAAAPMDLDEEQLQVYELIDGKRNVDRLVEITGISSFHVFKAVSVLMEDGIIEPVPPDDFVTYGKECMAEGRTQDAINIFERAVADEVAIPDVHTLCAEAYDTINEYELSTYHTKCVAEHKAANGKRREAIKLFRFVLDTIPTDLGACQRVVELSVGHPELTTSDFDPLRIGKDLVDLYLEMGEVERVRSLLEELLRENPSDIELKKSLINVHHKVGDTKRIVELYESIADDLTRDGDPIQAIKYLQKILQINRSRTDISERIKSLYQADERKRSRRRSLVALAGVFCMLVLAGVGYFFYDQTARRYYEKLDLKPLLDKKDFPGAIRVIKNFLETYPFTMVGKDAEAELVTLQARHDAWEAEQDAKVAQAQSRMERIRYQYAVAWQKGLTHIQQKNLNAALKDIETVRELVTKAGQPVDRQWEAENKVEKNYNELKNYLAMAAALERKIRGALDSKDWKLARAETLNLVEKFHMSDQAKAARIPVEFTTRPDGAMIYVGDQPVTEEVNGKQQPVRTPHVVLCPNLAKVALRLVKDGFEPTMLEVQPTKTATVSKVLSIRPSQQVQLSHPVTTPPAVGPDGTVAVGMRGGRVGLLRTGQPPVVFKLPGLSEIDGPPSATSQAVIFRTNDGYICSHRLSDARQNWRIRSRYPLAYEPVVHNLRLFMADREGRVFCMESYEGREVWSRTLDGRLSGRPTVFDGTVAVGSQGGTVMTLDVQQGRILKRIQLDRGVTTQVLRSRDYLVFGTEDGRLHAYQVGSKNPHWSIDVGRAIRNGELTMSDDGAGVLFVGADNILQRVDVETGKVKVKTTLGHRIRPSLHADEGRLYVVVQEETGKAGVKAVHQDLLLALDQNTLEVVWEYRDGGDFHGGVVSGAKHLFLTGSKGEVNVIR